MADLQVTTFDTDFKINHNFQEEKINSSTNNAVHVSFLAFCTKRVINLFEVQQFEINFTVQINNQLCFFICFQ